MTSLRKFIEARGFFRIPLKKLTTGHYQLHVEINGISGRFILDTGASTSCIGIAFDSYFHLNKEESIIKAAGAGAIDMETMFSSGNHFKIGNWEKRKMDFILFDLSHVNQALLQVNEDFVHGIIGADFLKEHRAIIDYGRNCFYII